MRDICQDLACSARASSEVRAPTTHSDTIMSLEVKVGHAWSHETDDPAVRIRVAADTDTTATAANDVVFNYGSA